MQIRLQKYLSKSGVASRRACEDYILQGRIKVNGKIIYELGTKVDPETDQIEVDGQIQQIKKRLTYIIMNKPKRILTTVRDPFGRRNVIDMLKGVKERIFPVGRLDKDTEGLLLLTNDGDVTYRLTHPKYEIVKTYMAKIKGVIGNEEINTLEKGVVLEDGITSPARVKILNNLHDSTIIEIKIHEGRKRQIRRMFYAVGHPVIELKRTRIGNLSLKGLKTGEWRFLNPEEIKYIRSL